MAPNTATVEQRRVLLEILGEGYGIIKGTSWICQIE